MTVGDRIRRERESRGLTQDELAEMCGYKGKSSISKIESSGDELTTKKVKRVADALGVEPALLMGWVEEEQRASEDFALLEAYHRLTPSGQTAVKVLIDTLLKAGG